MTSRGSSIRLQRSLRMRVLAACALSFLGLVAVVCLAMPRAYEAQAREAFRSRCVSLARSLAFLRVDPGSEQGRELVESWVAAEEHFVAAAIVTPDGRVVERWPDGSAVTSETIPVDADARQVSGAYVAYHPIITAEGESLVAAVRVSSDALVRDLENVRWLFASIFLFTCGVFFVLSLYLTRTILTPLEQIGRAAMDLADGEPIVEVPMTGDREIDDLGNFIKKLGENRRHSRVMENPLAVLSRSRKKGGKGDRGSNRGLTGSGWE